MMNLCDVHQIKPLLARHGFRFSKAKGQNFLIQSWVPQRIVREAGVDETCGALEIGPGIGSLTQQLCLRAKRVVAIELDTSLRPVLAETLGEFDNLQLVFGDVLKTDLAALVQTYFSGLRPVACANLPYYITSPILAALLESRQFAWIAVMVQKEVARRICAAPGTAEYSAFTVFCNFYAAPELLFDVPPDCFLPQPKVTSSVLKLTCRAAPPCPVLDEALFFRTVKAAFGQRRKTLVNALSAGFPELDKRRLADLVSAEGLPATVRGEALSLPAFASLANRLFQQR